MRIRVPNGERGQLLCAQNCVLGSLGHAELNDALGFDLDGFAGGGVATHARLAVDQNQFAQAREGEGVLGVFVGEVSDAGQDFISLLLAEAVLFRDGRDDLGLGECFCHNRYFYVLFVIELWSIARNASPHSKTFIFIPALFMPTVPKEKI